MKVLIIMTTQFKVSGITNNVMNYYRYLEKSDMKVDFVGPNKIPEKLKEEILANGGEIFELLMRNNNPIKYLNELTNIIAKGKYDIVHAHGNSCTLALEMCAAKLGGAKIRIAHSRNTTCQHTFFNNILRPIFDRTYTHGFACGVDAGKWLFRDKEFTVITNGNDVDKFSYNSYIRKEYRKKLNIQEKIVIGHVGLFNHQKNQEFLIDILKALVEINKDYVLVMVGEGALRSSVEQKANDMGLQDNIIFTGESLEVEKLIQAMDIMVLPSRYEGLPNVVIEWQIACIPCIISDKVDKDVKITELVRFANLEDGPQIWAQRISEIELIDRDTIKNKIINEVTSAGFNVKENSKTLKRIYKDLVATK